jgi:hypothetical protein
LENHGKAFFCGSALFFISPVNIYTINNNLAETGKYIPSRVFINTVLPLPATT